MKKGFLISVFGVIAILFCHLSFAIESQKQIETIYLNMFMEQQRSSDPIDLIPVYESTHQKTGLGPTLPQQAEDYIYFLVENFDHYNLARRGLSMVFDGILNRNSLRIQLANPDQRRTGQIYAMELSHQVHFTAHMESTLFVIEPVQGIVALAKLPIVSDEVSIRRLALDMERGELTIVASVIYNLFDIVARVNIRTRRFEGIDWLSTVFANLPSILEASSFVVVP